VYALEKDPPIALTRPRWLGVGMVDAGAIFRNEALVTSDDVQRFFLGVILENGLEQPGIVIVYNLSQRPIKENVNEFAQPEVCNLAKLFQAFRVLRIRLKDKRSFCLHTRQGIGQIEPKQELKVHD